jgi:hypothetical protein
MGESAGAPLHTISAAVQDAVYGEGIIIQESHHSPPALFQTLRHPNRAQVVRVKRR